MTRGIQNWALVLLILMIASAAAGQRYAKQWTMLDARDRRCLDSTAVTQNAVRRGLPSMTSPYDMTQELGLQRVPFTTYVTRDARGEVNAVQIVVSGSTSVFWFSSRDLCENFRGWAGNKGLLASPSELK